MQYIQEWYSAVHNSPKCVNYRIFKTEFKTEFYFTELQSKFYIPIARFRTTNHRLPIERGRWDNIERSQRICNLCTKNLLGYKFHYLFECDFSMKLEQYIYQRIINDMQIYYSRKVLHHLIFTEFLSSS